jgi:hypothetical protein
MVGGEFTLSKSFDPGRRSSCLNEVRRFKGLMISSFEVISRKVTSHAHKTGRVSPPLLLECHIDV